MRVVITFAGGITRLGDSIDQIYKNLNGSFPKFSSLHNHYVNPIEGFNLKNYIGRYKNSRYLSRGAQLTVAGAIKTVKDSGFELPEECGLFVGQGPNMDTPEAGFNYETEKALWLLKYLPNTSLSVISSLLNIHGENSVIGTACSASLQAIGEAYKAIKLGCCKMAIAGGGDSRLSLGGIKGYSKAGALYKGDNPDINYSPLSSQPMGFIPGEGSAFFILESLDSAVINNRDIIVEVVGYSATMDAYAMTSPEPSGKFQKIAVLNALKQAGINSEDIDFISSHGTGTLLNDTMEGKIIEELFNKEQVTISFKQWFGHLAAGCGAVELLATLACMKNNFLPRRKRDGIEGELEFKYNPVALLQNFGFGGQNAALVVKRW